MASLLIEGDSPFCFQPALAKYIGLNQAIVLQQLSYLLSRECNGRFIDGERWVFNTYEKWRDHFFPFWSVPTIQRIFAELEDRALVVSCQPEGSISRRKYYRLGAGCLHLTKERIAEHIKLIPSPSHQIDMMRNVSDCDVPLTENTQETSIATACAAAKRSGSKPRKPNPLFDALAQACGMTGTLNSIEGGRVGVALKAIRESMPDVTPEEIRRRAGNYSAVMPPKSTLTPTALAANWARCGIIAKRTPEDRLTYV
jgi:hypothetical protein